MSVLPSFFLANVKKTNGCWHWRRWRLKRGYGMSYCADRKIKILAHRHAWELAYGEIPKGMCVCHKCDTPSCVRPSHLFIGSRKDNMQDCARKGRTWRGGSVRGEQHYFSKLTNEDVRAIRRDKISSSNALAKVYGVTHRTILLARHRKTWRHIT